VIDGADAVMTPIMGGRGVYNHLSVRSAVGIVLDRFFGFR
jgi:tRNA (guanine37-N1)-methyltransferase